MIAEGLQEKEQTQQTAAPAPKKSKTRKRKTTSSKETTSSKKKMDVFARANAKARLRKCDDQTKKPKLSRFFDTFKLGAQVYRC